MICFTCDKCQSVKADNDVLKVSCQDNGLISVHSTHGDAFRCDSYVTHEPVVPQKDNVLIILKCGRDLTTLDVDIKNLKDMSDRMDGEFARFGSLEIRVDEIAVWGLI